MPAPGRASKAVLRLAPGPCSNCVQRAELRSFLCGAQRDVGTQDLAHWRTANDRLFRIGARANRGRMRIPAAALPGMFRQPRGIAALPSWRDAITTNDAALAAWRSH